MNHFEAPQLEGYKTFKFKIEPDDVDGFPVEGTPGLTFLLGNTKSGKTFGFVEEEKLDEFQDYAEENFNLGGRV